MRNDLEGRTWRKCLRRGEGQTGEESFMVRRFKMNTAAVSCSCVPAVVFGASRGAGSKVGRRVVRHDGPRLRSNSHDGRVPVDPNMA